MDTVRCACPIVQCQACAGTGQAPWETERGGVDMCQCCEGAGDVPAHEVAEYDAWAASVEACGQWAEEEVLG